MPKDTDGDGIPDSEEGSNSATSSKTNLYLPDSDGDGLIDGLEDLNRNGVPNEFGETNPRNRNSDSDAYADGVEVLLIGCDPLAQRNPSLPGVDWDGDELPLTFGLDPDDSEVDIDNDRFLDGYAAVVLGLASVNDSSSSPGLGDVNQNNVRDNGDSQLILNFFAQNPCSNCDPASGDLDRNEVIDNADSQVSLNFFGHILPFLPRIP